MTHVTEQDVIKLVAGGMAPGRRQELEAHLAGCPACRELFAAQQAVYRVLGDWEVEATGRDVTSAIERGLAERRVLGRIGIAYVRYGRVAAAVVVGLGVGYAAGLLAAPGNRQRAQSSEIDAQTALANLGFDVLASPFATGLYAAVVPPLPDPTDTGDAP